MFNEDCNYELERVMNECCNRYDEQGNLLGNIEEIDKLIKLYIESCSYFKELKDMIAKLRKEYMENLNDIKKTNKKDFQ